MSYFILASLLLAPAVAASPTAGGVMAHVEGRNTTSLDGKWAVIVDPYESGYYDFRYQPRGDGYFKDKKPRDARELVEYDFDASGTLDVPGDWNSQRESLFFYEGTVWYRRLFDYRKTAATRVFLYFGAVNYHAVVYLNGEKLGEHVGGFTPFQLEITDRVRTGANSLVLKVDNRRYREAVPTLLTDWWNYGGITRRVRLVEVPAIFIEDYFLQLAKGSRDQVSGWVRLNGAAHPQQVRIEIPEAGVDVRFTTDASGVAAISFRARLDLWSPEKPKLYDVRLSGATDAVSERIGFRSIEVDGDRILLNGEPIFLRGVSIHEEAPMRAGRAWSQEDARTLLGWAQEMGANFVRLAHYPHEEWMAREADRMGLLVWSEIPVYWMIAWENADTLANARRQLAESIGRDKNRASVILWSVANETPVTAERNVFLKTLIDDARALDPTRLVTAALMHRAVADTQVVDDPLGEWLDVIGCNEYIGWYGEAPPEYAERVTWESRYGKPLIMSEFGADARFGRHGEEDARWTEEYQEKLYRHTIVMLKRIPFLRGTSPWILMDFRSPRRPLPGIQDWFNRKGLVSERGEKKKAFFVMQRFYEELRAAGASRGKSQH